MRELFQRNTGYLIGEFASKATNCSEGCLLSVTIEQAALLFKSGSYADAISLARKKTATLSEASAHDLRHCRDLWEIKADAYASQHQLIDAIRCSKEVLRLSLILADQEVGLPYVSLAHLALGHYYFDTGCFDSALEHYQFAEKFLPHPLGYRTLIAGILVALSDCHANMGELKQALSRADQVIEMFAQPDGPDDVSICFQARDRRAFYLAWSGHADTAEVESGLLIHDIRRAADTDSQYLSDLARCLDHRAEILERSRRFHEAVEVAEESTRINREMALADASHNIALLHSLITLARLSGLIGQAEKAIALCDEAHGLLSSIAHSPDLAAHILACHGRNLMTIGQHASAEPFLQSSINIFRQLSHVSEGAAIFRDALAELNIDLGDLYLKTNPWAAQRKLTRAVAWKRRIARNSPITFHQLSLAEAYVALGHADLRMQDHLLALKHFDAALAVISKQKILSASFPSLAVRLTLGLVAAFDVRMPAPPESLDKFLHLARAMAIALDFSDDDIAESLRREQQAFLQHWLGYFIRTRDGRGIIELLAFAHGRRLALLAMSELKHLAAEQNTLSPTSRLLILQREIRRLDLEQAEILGARTPSSINTIPAANTSSTLGTRNAMIGAGASIEDTREALYAEYVSVRDHLYHQGLLPLSSSRIVSSTDIWPPADSGVALVVWCLPVIFGLDHPPLMVVLLPDSIDTKLLEVPEIGSAHELLTDLLVGWNNGRAGDRGSAIRPASHTPSLMLNQLEDALFGQLNLIWQSMLKLIGTHAIAEVHMVTHAATHNLPWLGSSPNSLDVRQFPSLHHYAGRKQARPPPLPSPEHPLILLIDENGNSPLNTLYFMPLEIQAIHHAWPGSVLEVSQLEADAYDHASAIWIIGHGIHRNGQTLLGNRLNHYPIDQPEPTPQGNGNLGLIYASTCYLGQISDIAGEPVGLPRIAALNPVMPVTAGAIAPVDDLEAALLGMLFHFFWKETGNARQAFDSALKMRRKGEWPENHRETIKTIIGAVQSKIESMAHAHLAIDSSSLASLFPSATPSQRLRKQFWIKENAQRSLDKLRRLQFQFDLSILSNKEPEPPNMTLISVGNYWSWLG